MERLREFGRDDGCEAVNTYANASVGTYTSPLGTILLAADEVGLIGLWFEDQHHAAFDAGFDLDTADRSFGSESSESSESEQTGGLSAHLNLQKARYWLDTYFSGRKPDGSLPLHMRGTPFQMEVWELLGTIPWGETRTYGELARIVACQRGVASMSAQAIGAAIGKNPVSIIVPCHRVVGVHDRLVGYAGGIDRKQRLLELEGHDLSRWII